MSKLVFHSLKAAFVTVVIFIGSGLFIPKVEAQNMPFRSSLHDAALREALSDSVLSLAQTAGAAEAGSPWAQWHVRHVHL